MLADILTIIFFNYLLFNIAYYLPSAILFYIDYYNYFSSNKIQPKYSEYMSYYSKSFWSVITNTLIFALVPISFYGWYEVTHVKVFSLGKILLDIIGCLILTDIFFYLIHRLFHHPWLYGRFHKQHHEMIAPVGFSAVYMTAGDFLLANAVPVYLPLYLVGAHGLTIKLWIILTTLNTVILSHSGFKYLAEFHDAHHSHFKKNYGTNLFMDRLFGTHI